MKTTKHAAYALHFFTAFFLLFSLTVWAGEDEETKQKVYNKSFQVGTNDLLRVDNRFGNISVSYWEKKELAIRVVVKAKAIREKRLKELLDRVDIQISKEGNEVSAITTLRSQKGSNDMRESFSIDYFIDMPATVSCMLSQKYGNIHLPEKNSAKCKLKTQYGNIEGGDFSAPLQLDIRYGNATLKDCSELTIDGKYSNFTLGTIGNLSLEAGYGNMQIKGAEHALLNLKYSKCIIDNMEKTLAVPNLDYTTLKVQNLHTDFEKVDASARFGNLYISTDKKASFSVFASNLKYGRCRVQGYTTVQRISDEESSDSFDSRSEKSKPHSYQLKINKGKKGVVVFNGNGYSNLEITSR